MLVQKLLGEIGLKVVAAPTGESAVEVFNHHGAEITFAVLDLTLPGISGIETQARLRQIRPDLEALLTRGYERETIQGCRDEDGFIDFIQKPYEIATFHHAVSSVCERLQTATPASL